MFIYKRTIKSGEMIEVEYYKSFRQVGKNYGGRRINNHSLTPEKQKLANKIRAVKNIQRKIHCNFKVRDYFVRFSCPYAQMTEEKFEKVVSKFLRKMRDKLRAQGKKFKYIGFCECGKSGKNWHMHIVIERDVLELAMDLWEFDGGVNFTPLYKRGNFEALAEYITKDVNGAKRMKTSRGLNQPEVNVKEAGKRELKKLENGEMIKIPEGYYLVNDETTDEWNYVTGASWNFVFMPLVWRIEEN
jgi:hypothetical protein